eukprot:TRINITY_DN31028_c0_g1_i1.p1 TRINITY_DN31028_c0_g1~~TRINITY_DN31028_c0_g1_i1.p1  ORF type:complete len:148 (+),score=39.47 TRINITY_DN31028_c0_g1_i1:314-757(+)
MDKHRSVPTNFFRGVDFAIVVADATRLSKTLDDAAFWKAELDAAESKTQSLLWVNKTDLLVDSSAFKMEHAGALDAFVAKHKFLGWLPGSATDTKDVSLALWLLLKNSDFQVADHQDESENGRKIVLKSLTTKPEVRRPDERCCLFT